jgi:hypothetical protein
MDCLEKYERINKMVNVIAGYSEEYGLTTYDELFALVEEKYLEIDKLIYMMADIRRQYSDKAEKEILDMINRYKNKN